MKMQIAFRETNTVRHGHRVAMAVGVIEVGPDDKADYEEKALALRFDFNPGSGHAVAVSTYGQPRKLVSEWVYLDTELATGTLEGLLTASIERAIPNSLHNADVILRETEVQPAIEGGKVFAFSGFVHVKPDQEFIYKDVVWYESQLHGHDSFMAYAGRSGFERRPSDGRRDMVETMRGAAMSGFLREPLWGFGEEAYALPGTMRLSMYRKMDRYRELFFSGRDAVSHKEEFAILKEEMRTAGLDNVEKDADFQAFSREMHLKYPDLIGNKPRTGKQQQLYAEKANEVILQINEAEGFSRSYGR